MPTLTVDDDWGVVDNLQTITYFVKLNDFTPFPSGVPVSNVLQRGTGKKLLESGISAVMSVFHIWANQCDFFPKANDKLTDSDGVSWIVKEVQAGTFETRYRLTCQITQ